MDYLNIVPNNFQEHRIQNNRQLQTIPKTILLSDLVDKLLGT